MRSLLLALLLIALIPEAHAIDPESGWWYNANASGRGYNLEVQGNTIGIAAFVYDADGNSEWYTGTGPISGDTFTASLYRFVGGQCIGCSYTVPQTQGPAIAVSITFTDSAHGTMTLDGNTFPIERFNFGYPDELSEMLGEWSIVDSDPTGSGYVLEFNSRCTLNDGSSAVCGGQVNTTLGTAAVASISNGAVSIALATQNSSSVDAWAITLTGFDRGTGSYWQLQSGQTPATSNVTGSALAVRAVASGIAKAARVPNPDLIQRAQAALADLLAHQAASKGNP